MKVCLHVSRKLCVVWQPVLNFGISLGCDRHESYGALIFWYNCGYSHSGSGKELIES